MGIVPERPFRRGSHLMQRRGQGHCQPDCLPRQTALERAYGARQVGRFPISRELFCAKAAQGLFLLVLEDTCALLQNLDILEHIGFVVDFHRGVSLHMTLEQGHVAEQDTLSTAVMVVAINLCRRRISGICLAFVLAWKTSFDHHRAG